MKFALLELNEVPKKGTIGQWRLIIDSKEDLDNYHGYEGHSYSNALLSMARNSKTGEIETSHIGGAATKEMILARWLSMRKETAKEGEKIYPLIEMANLVDRKYLGQLKHITNIGAIQINEAGGWCGLDGFLSTWNGRVLKYIEKETCAFPSSEKSLIADTICLENSHPEYGGSYLKEDAKKVFGNKAGVIEVIYNLREIDIDYIKQSVLNAKNIYINTQVQDDNQLELFMRLFEKMPPKTIFINVYRQAEKDKICANHLFEKVDSIHSVTITVYR